MGHRIVDLTWLFATVLVIALGAGYANLWRAFSPINLAVMISALVSMPLLAVLSAALRTKADIDEFSGDGSPVTLRRWSVVVLILGGLLIFLALLIGALDLSCFSWDSEPSRYCRYFDTWTLPPSLDYILYR